ncbi:hypothetical protein MB02_14130 [Croceicoccus estronivorus]|nr:hypothetical protein MB02_14130 [Croceicoccus estronivorus]
MHSGKALFAGLAALSLAIVPSMAAAKESAANRLALSNAVIPTAEPLRVGSPVQKSEKSISTTALVVITALTLGGIALAFGLGDDDNSPASP